MKERKEKQTYIYLTELGKIIACGELALREREAKNKELQENKKE